MARRAKIALDYSDLQKSVPVKLAGLLTSITLAGLKKRATEVAPIFGHNGLISTRLGHGFSSDLRHHHLGRRDYRDHRRGNLRHRRRRRIHHDHRHRRHHGPLLDGPR